MRMKITLNLLYPLCTKAFRAIRVRVPQKTKNYGLENKNIKIVWIYTFLFVISQAMFEKEIEEYERVRKDYQRKVAD